MSEPVKQPSVAVVETAGTAAEMTAPPPTDEMVQKEDMNKPEELIRVIEPEPDTVRKSELMIDENFTKQLELDLQFVHSGTSVSASVKSTESSYDSDDSVGSYVKQKSIEAKPDFFDILGEIPDIDEISMDLSFDFELAPVEARISVPEIADVGHFVDPLTGEHLKPEVIDTKELEEVEEEEEIEDEDVSLGSDDEMEMDLPVEIEEEIVRPLPEPEVDVFDAFCQLEKTKKVSIDIGTDYEMLERQRAFLEISNNTHDFLQDLIKRIVDKCDRVSPESLLRQNISKTHLMHEMDRKLSELDEEGKVRLFLIRKTIDFFRRRKLFRAILDDHQDTVQADTAKYSESIKHLDKMLSQFEEITKTTETVVNTLTADAIEKQEKADNDYKLFEELVAKTLTKREGEGFEKLQQLLSTAFKDMQRTRKEIAKTRMLLIQRQHTYAALLEKSEKLENLGNGLQMDDFDHLQTQTQALGKKIEEKNADLNKMRSRFNSELHILAHVKESQQMLSNTNSLYSNALKELINEKKKSRGVVYNSKMHRDRIRKQISKLSFQGGILDKPDLMVDYDNTVEKLKLLCPDIYKKKYKVLELQQKINEAEIKLF